MSGSLALDALHLFGLHPFGQSTPATAAAALGAVVMFAVGVSQLVRAWRYHALAAEGGRLDGKQARFAAVWKQLMTPQSRKSQLIGVVVATVLMLAAVVIPPIQFVRSGLALASAGMYTRNVTLLLFYGMGRVRGPRVAAELDQAQHVEPLSTSRRGAPSRQDPRITDPQHGFAPGRHASVPGARPSSLAVPLHPGGREVLSNRPRRA